MPFLGGILGWYTNFGNWGIPILGTSDLGVQIRYTWEFFFVKVNIDILRKHFNFLAYQKGVQLLKHIKMKL